MPCYFPLTGFRADVANFKTGKRKIVFKEAHAQWPLTKVTLPCGSCIGCRFERSRQWALRCVHESSLHDENCWLTLTYNKENLPSNLSLDKKHFQDFMKRLRKHYNLPTGSIRYYMCGEYGEKFARPHYHACIFGLSFGLDRNGSKDRKFLKKTKNGDNLYYSETLNKIWGFGHVYIGEMTFETAAYTARYIMKKQNGPEAETHYRHLDETTGEQKQIIPEYTTMSRRPGIGNAWYEKWKDDVFPSDEVIIKGKQMNPPKYYDNLLELEDPITHTLIKQKRLLNAQLSYKDYTPERLHVKHQVKLAQAKLLSRTLEEN